MSDIFTALTWPNTSRAALLVCKKSFQARLNKKKRFTEIETQKQLDCNFYITLQLHLNIYTWLYIQLILLVVVFSVNVIFISIQNNVI